MLRVQTGYIIFHFITILNSLGALLHLIEAIGYSLVSIISFLGNQCIGTKPYSTQVHVAPAEIWTCDRIFHAHEDQHIHNYFSNIPVYVQATENLGIENLWDKLLITFTPSSRENDRVRGQIQI